MKRKHFAVMWFLSGSENKASSRLHGYLLHRELVRRGLLSQLVFSPSRHDVGDFQGFSRLPVKLNLVGVVSIIQKLDGSNTDKLIRWLRWCGCTVVYVECDLRPSQESWRNSDKLFVTSTLLKDYFDRLSTVPVSIVKEPYDFSFPPNRMLAERSRGALTVAWFGNKGNFGALSNWKEIIVSRYSRQLRLITCSNHPDADMPWSLDNLRSLLSTADIAVLPTEQGCSYDAKSPNRLIQCMAAGLPTIAGPLAAYQEVKSAGAPVFIAENDKDFCQYVDRLLLESYREEVALESYRFVAEDYAIGSVVDEWVDLLSIEPCGGIGRFLCCIRLTMFNVWLIFLRFIARKLFRK